jgi:hypothetical protein
MAILKGGVDGPISGLVGTVICYKVGEVNYVRGKIGQRSKNSWSEKQVLHRKRISGVGSFWKSLAKNPARASWRAAAGLLPGFSLFLKTNFAAFSSDGSQVDLEYLHLSTGPLPLPHLLKASVTEGNPTLWEASWLNDTGKGLAKLNDELLVMVVRDGKFSNSIATGAKRGDKSASVQLPNGEGTVQGIYLSFSSSDRTSYSPDQFFVA